jgi:hypothetical protein
MVNNKFFKGKSKGLPDNQYVQTVKNDFLQNKENNILFSDKSKFKFKKFPTPRDIIRDLPINESTIANAHSLLSWIHYSEYVHHSIISTQSDTNSRLREIEIRQMKTVMLFAYKQLKFTKFRLDERNIPTKLNQEDTLIEELCDGTVESSSFL